MTKEKEECMLKGMTATGHKGVFANPLCDAGFKLIFSDEATMTDFLSVLIPELDIVGLTYLDKYLKRKVGQVSRHHGLPFPEGLVTFSKVVKKADTKKA